MKLPYLFFLSCRSEILPCIGDHVVVKNHMTGMDRLAKFFSACGCCHVRAFGDHHFLYFTLNSCANEVRKSNIFHSPFCSFVSPVCLYVFYPGVVRYIGPIVGDKKRQYAGLHLDSPGKIIVIPL